MSAIRTPSTHPASTAPAVPRYVYAMAILLLAWASVLLVTWVSLKQFDPVFWRAMIPVTLELAIGWGLLRRRRWGWMLGIATALLFIADGLRLIILIPGVYAVITALIHRLIPAAVILVCLLPGRARRAFLADEEAGSFG